MSFFSNQAHLVSRVLLHSLANRATSTLCLHCNRHRFHVFFSSSNKCTCRAPSGIQVAAWLRWNRPGQTRLSIRHSRPFHLVRSEEHTSELQSLMRISYAVFCLKKKHRHVTHTPSRAEHLHLNYVHNCPHNI